MFERPLMPSCFASLYSCSLVRPFGRLVPERCPPRFDDGMSLTDEREAVFDWPLCARSLFTVLAAISFARRVGAPRSLRLSLMCSYLRSCLSVHSSLGMSPPRPLRGAGPHLSRFPG